MKNFTKIFAAVFFLIQIAHCTLNIYNCEAQWIQQPVPNNTGILLSIDFANVNTGIAGGWYNFLGKALYTSDGGSHWVPSTVPDTSRSFVAVTFIDSLTGYMAGAYNLFTDQSSNVTLDVLLKKGFTRSAIRYLENIGISGVDYKALFVKTTDGGRSWFTHGILPPQFTYLYGVDFLDANTGVMTTSIQDTSFNMNSTIVKTTNGGLTWTEILNVDSVLELKAVEFIDLNNIIAVGRGGSFDSTISHVGGMIFRSTNAGANWNLQFYLHEEFNDVCFTDQMTGFIANQSQGAGKIYKTTNQGLNWNVVLTQNNSLIYGIKFYKGSGTGIMYGDLNLLAFVRRTTDYGVTWGELQFPDTTGQYLLHGGAMVSNYNHSLSGGFPFGQAVIYHTTNGGMVNIESLGNSIPVKFSLSQNYPYPFNPKTIINYELRVTSYAKLVVYDIIGKEVATLVNEKQNPGTYHVNFDGSGFSSGVYFYRLTAGEFTETKKMSFLK